MTDLFGKPVMLDTARAPLTATQKRTEARQRLAAKRMRALVTKFGPGPEGAKCGACAHFLRLRHHDYSYAKCDLYGKSHSEATDWRAKWSACGKFFEAEQVAKKKAAPRSQPLTAEQLGALLERR